MELKNSRENLKGEIRGSGPDFDPGQEEKYPEENSYWLTSKGWKHSKKKKKKSMFTLEPSLSKTMVSIHSVYLVDLMATSW